MFEWFLLWIVGIFASSIFLMIATTIVDDKNGWSEALDEEPETVSLIIIASWGGVLLITFGLIVCAYDKWKEK